MSKTAIPVLDIGDIQAAVLRPRPSPYKGQYVVLRIDDAAQGREMLRRIIPHVAPAEEWWEPSIPAWFGIVFTYHGLKALGLPQESLDSFPEEFSQGMAARASILNDVGDNAPVNWEQPFGTADVHVALAIYSSDEKSLDTVLELARQSHIDLPRISVIYRMKFSELPEGRNPFGFKDGLHNPQVEGSSINPPVGSGATIKPGEIFTLEELQKQPPSYLFEELEERLRKAPVVFNLVLQLAEEGDPTDDPTAPWPEDRSRVPIGRLELVRPTTVEEIGDPVMLHDPTRLTDGIEPSDDPVLAVRLGVYEVSVAHRTGGWKGRLAALERAGPPFLLYEQNIWLSNHEWSF